MKNKKIQLETFRIGTRDSLMQLVKPVYNYRTDCDLHFLCAQMSSLGANDRLSLVGSFE